jgi:uncharacterized membrane protein
MLAATVAVLVAGFALQLAFYGHGGHQALSDLPRVLLHRGIGPREFPYVDRVIEYPVGAGLLLYVATLLAPGSLGAFAVTAIASAALCVAITVVLERRCGARAWRWAIGMPVLLFAFQNWDVFAIAALLGALFAFQNRRDRLSGALIGLGAAIKLFPAVALPVLMALRLRRDDRRGAARLVGWAAGVFIALNLPFAIARPTGWWWSFAFQGRREATWGTAWFYLYRLLGVPVHGAGSALVANMISFAALAVTLAWLVWRAWRVQLDSFAATAAAIALFLLTTKVYSPTYDLWLLPFFVLVPLSRRLWFTFCAVDLWVFVAVYGYLDGIGSAWMVRVALPLLVLARVAVLCRIVVFTTRPARPLRSNEAPREVEPCESS